MSDKTSL